MSNFSNSWANALDVDHVNNIFNVITVDELDLPNGGSVVMKGASAFLRFTNPVGGYHDYPIVMRGLSKSDANREKRNMVDTAGLYGYAYKHGEPAMLPPTGDQKRDLYVVGEWICSVTKMTHITSRSIADQERRGPIDLARGIMRWDCDGELAGDYRILAYGVSEEEGNQLKRSRYEQNYSLGFNKCPRRDKVPYFMSQAQSLTINFAKEKVYA
jgi:hypothetical protein